MKGYSIAPFITFIALNLAVVAPWLGSYGLSLIVTQHQAVESTMITVDGLGDDWQDYQPLVTDNKGDGDAVDVKSVYSLVNDRYFYLMIETYEAIGRYSHVDVSINCKGNNGVREYMVSFTPFLGTLRFENAYAYVSNRHGQEARKLLGTLSAQDQVIEFRMPLEFVECRQDLFAVKVDFLIEASTGTPRSIDKTSWRPAVRTKEREPSDNERTDRMKANLLTTEGIALYYQKDYHGALLAFETALTMYKAMGEKKPDDKGIDKMKASILAAEGVTLDAQVDHRGALQAFEAALTIYEDSGDRLAEASICRRIAELYSEHLGNPQQSVAYYQRAYEIYRDLGLRDLESDIALQIGLRLVSGLLGVGDIAQARDYLDEALEIKRSLGDLPGEATGYRALGAFYRNIGDFQQALAFYQKALAIYRDLGEKRGEADVALGLGNLYRDLGDYSTTEKYWQEWLEIRRELDGQAGELWGANQLATLYYEMKDYPRALEFGLKVIKLCDQIMGECQTGNFYSNLGLFYAGLGDYNAAEQNFQTALEITRRTGYRTGEALAHLDLADVNAKLGETQEALQNYRQALNIYQEIDAKAQQADVRLEIGSLYADLGHYDEALAYQLESLENFQTIGDPAGEVRAHQQLGETYKASGNLETALDHYQQAVAMVEGLRGHLTIEELKGNFSALFADVYEGTILVQLELDQQEDAFAYTERARARTFLDQLGYRQLDPRAGAAPDLVAREQELANQISALQSHLSSSVSPDYAALRGQLETLQADYNQVLIDLKLSNPAYAALVSISPLSLADIRNKVLADQTTPSTELRASLVSYFVTEEKTIAFVADRDDLIAVTLPITRTELAHQVDYFRQLIQVEPSGGPTQTRERTQLAQELHQILIAPLLPHLRHPRLIIIPHQALHYLPFAALLDENEQPLATRFTLSTAPSASSLDPALLGHSDNDGHLLVVGNPAIPSTLVAPLPHAEAEAKAVAALYPHSTLFTGSQATETALRAHLADTDILHLATHASLDPVNPLFSTLLLATETITPSLPSAAGNDGRLEVREVFNLDLHQANLVVLSACDTALGEQSRGDELVGLSRAFLYAGTPVVVASLWPVEDEATEALLVAFHRRVQAGVGPAAALAEAQAEVRDQVKWAAPYYWAGFVVMGDGGREAAATLPAATATPLPTVTSTVAVPVTATPEGVAGGPMSIPVKTTTPAETPSPPASPLDCLKLPAVLGAATALVAGSRAGRDRRR